MTWLHGPFGFCSRCRVWRPPRGLKHASRAQTFSDNVAQLLFVISASKKQVDMIFAKGFKNKAIDGPSFLSGFTNTGP